jgi:hypothetical protein
VTGEELVQHLARDCEQPRDVVLDILRALADTVESELQARRSVTLPGLGSIQVFDSTDPARPVKVTWYTEDKLRKRLVESLRAAAARRDTPPRRIPGARALWADSVSVVAEGLSQRRAKGGAR